MSCLPALQPGLYSSPAEGRGDAGDAVVRSAQSVLLQHDDDGDQGSYREHCYAEYKEKKLEGVTGNYKDKV